MSNVVYDNFFLSNEIEDQYNSHLIFSSSAPLTTT